MPTKFPPYLTLEEAIRIINKMYSEHQSKEISIDLMPDILESKKGSSFFPSKINALQKFGLIEKLPNDILGLTELAMQIINPIGENELREAKIQAFKKVDVLNDLLAKYPNGRLPSPEQLQLYIKTTYQIPRDNLKKWHDFITDSFRAITDSLGKSYPIMSDTAKSNEPILQNVRSTTLHNFKTASKKLFEYSIEDNYTQEDLDFIIGFFQLMKNSLKNKGNQ